MGFTGRRGFWRGRGVDGVGAEVPMKGKKSKNEPPVFSGFGAFSGVGLIVIGFLVVGLAMGFPRG